MGQKRVREGEGKRERDGEWEKDKERYTQFGGGSTNGPSNRGRVGWVNAKIGWIFVSFNDLWGRNYLNEIFAYL